MDELFALGAFDVYFTHIGMKKSRPGVMLTCMCSEEKRKKIRRSALKPRDIQTFYDEKIKTVSANSVIHYVAWYLNQP